MCLLPFSLPRHQTRGERYRSRGRQQEFVFPSPADMSDTMKLVIHYLSFMPSIQTEDTFRMSGVLHNVLPQLINVPSPTNGNHTSAVKNTPVRIIGIFMP